MTDNDDPADAAPLTPAPKAVRHPTLVEPPPIKKAQDAAASRGAPEAESEQCDESGSDAAITRANPIAATAIAGDTGPTKLSRELESIHPKSDPLVGATLDGKYKLLSVLGQGAMGRVFQGEHLALATPIAVKVMKPEVAAQRDYVRRFRREAQAMSALTHTNVVRVLDFGYSKVFYIVMEFVRGQSAGDWLDTLTAPPGLGLVKNVMLQLCDALEAAHARGIVHRDLKPDNLLLTVDDAGGMWVKVTDFGLAHVEGIRDGEPTLTREGTVAGTPYYMSPEQCRSLTVGPSTDLYALGCVLTCLLQLVPPFIDGSAMEVMSAQMFASPPPLDRPADAEVVPPLLERLRMELLAKQPHQRPKDVATVRERMLEAFNPELSAARLPPRKTTLAAGDRAERAVAPDRERSGRFSLPPGAEEVCRVGILRPPDTSAVDQALLTGMGSHGVRLKEITSLERASEYDVLVLDCGNHVDLALEWLAELASAAEGHPAAAKLSSFPSSIVYVNTPSAQQVKRLIEAGASEVAGYPLAADSLGRRVLRLQRRSRAKT